MPLASWYSHLWYPGHASMIETSVATSQIASPTAVRRMSIVGTVSPSENIRATVSKTMSLLNSSVSYEVLSMKGITRMSLLSKIGELSQDDVTGAVLEAEVEPGITMKQAMRLTLAALVGKVSGAEGTSVSFRNPADTKTRIAATVDASGNRTAVTTDASDG